jgi:hypothetical protein
LAHLLISYQLAAEQRLRQLLQMQRRGFLAAAISTFPESDHRFYIAETETHSIPARSG